MAVSGAAMRASDQDREAAVRILRDGFVDGRLDLAELQDRAGAAYRARTWADLCGLIDDLPSGSDLPMLGDPPVPARPVPAPGARVASMLLIVLAVLSLAATGWASAAFIPLVLLSLSVLSAARCSALCRGRTGWGPVGQSDDAAGHDGQ